MGTLQNWLLVSDDESGRSAVLWNALGSGIFVGQAAILLLFASRLYTLEEAGAISLAYALANLVLAVAKFGMRNYQATDLEERYSLAAYARSRALTTVGAIVLAAGYVTWQLVTGAYGTEKAAVVLAVVLLKLVDAVEDLVAARYQQVGRFAVGAKLTALHQGAVTALLCGMAAARMPLPAALFAGTLASAALLASLAWMTWGVAAKTGGRAHGSGDVVGLLRQCAPLCVATVLSIYAGNMPKYAIDAFLDDDVQAVFGYIMLPVFVVTLLNQFMYQPFVRDLGELWASGEVRGFRRRVRVHCAAVMAVATVTLAASVWVGLPLLSALYAVDLGGYGTEFVVLMVGGVLYTLSAYLTVPLTAMRAQRGVALGYGVSCAASALLQARIVPTLGLMGASFLYVAQNALLLLVLIIVFLRACDRGAIEE